METAHVLHAMRLFFQLVCVSGQALSDNTLGPGFPGKPSAPRSPLGPFNDTRISSNFVSNTFPDTEPEYYLDQLQFYTETYILMTKQVTLQIIN